MFAIASSRAARQIGVILASGGGGVALKIVAAVNINLSSLQTSEHSGLGCHLVCPGAILQQSCRRDDLEESVSHPQRSQHALEEE